MATPNKNPGTCSCGSFVDAGDGIVTKVGGKWRVTCDVCQPAKRMAYEVVRILVPDLLGPEIHDPVPILYPTIEDARAMARRIYAGDGGYTDADKVLMCEIHQIEIRGKNAAVPVGFQECVAA